MAFNDKNKFVVMRDVTDADGVSVSVFRGTRELAVLRAEEMARTEPGVDFAVYQRVEVLRGAVNVRTLETAPARLSVVPS